MKSAKKNSFLISALTGVMEIEVVYLTHKSREKCHECGGKFHKEKDREKDLPRTLQIMLTDFGARDAWFTGGDKTYYHLECFYKMRPTLDLTIVNREVRYVEVPAELRVQLREVLEKGLQGVTKNCIGSQNMRLFARKKMLEGWRISDLKVLLEHNRQFLPTAKDEV